MLTTAAVLALVFSWTPSIAFAVEGETDQTAQTTTMPVTDETAATELKTRLEKRKADLKTRLTNLQKTVLKNKCKAAQGKLSSVSGRAKGVLTSRTKVHENLVARLENLSEKLDSKGVDTAEFKDMIAELKAKIATFETDYAIYQQTITDLESMDCVTEPDGFKASLDAARLNLQTVSDDAKAIRSYLTDSIKPLLVTIRTQLAGTQAEEE